MYLFVCFHCWVLCTWQQKGYCGHKDLCWDKTRRKIIGSHTPIHQPSAKMDVILRDVGYTYAWVMLGWAFKSWSDLTGISVTYSNSPKPLMATGNLSVCMYVVHILPQWFSSVEWAPISGDVPSERWAAETRHRLLEPPLCFQTGQTNKQKAMLRTWLLV